MRRVLAGLCAVAVLALVATALVKRTSLAFTLGVGAVIPVLSLEPGQEACPWWNGAPTFFPPTLDPKRMVAYVAGAEGCMSATASKTPMDEQKDYVGLPPCCTQQGPICGIEINSARAILAEDDEL